MIRTTFGTLLFITLPAIAQVKTYNFTAEIGSMFEHDSQTGQNADVSTSALPGSLFRIGDQIRGEFTYDTTALPSPYDLNGSGDGYLVFSNAVRSLSFTVGSTGYHYEAAFGPQSNIVLSDDSTHPLEWDAFSPFSSAAYDPFVFRSANISLFDRTGSAFEGYALPAALSLDSFHYRNLHFGWLRRQDGAQFHFDAAIESLLPPSTVPEPSSVALLLSGLVLTWFRGRYRQRKANSKQDNPA